MGTLTADRAKGAAPLIVTFTGGSERAFFGGLHADFGDGASAVLCRPGRSCRDATVTHVYDRPGAYTATLVGVGEGARGPLASVTITVE